MMKSNRRCSSDDLWLALALSASTAACASTSPPTDGGADAAVAADVGDAGPSVEYTESMIPGMCDDLSTVGVRPPVFNPMILMVALNNDLPFSITFLGRDYVEYSASPTGYVDLGEFVPSGAALANQPLPPRVGSSRSPKLSVFWDALAYTPDGPGGPSDILVATFGTTPSRRFVIHWANWTFADEAERDARLTFQLKLFETTNVAEFHYCVLTPGRTPDLVTGGSASIGISHLDLGVQHSFDTPGALGTASAIRYTPR